MPNTLWIETRLLRVGLYVYLDLGWMDHPFAFNHFKINNEQQLQTIRTLGLDKVRYSPDQSDQAVALAVAAPQPTAPPPTASPPPPASAVPAQGAAQKQAMVAKMKERRAAADRIEKAFVATAHTIRNIERQLYNQPAQAIAATQALVAQIADSILSAPEMVIQVIGDKPGNEELYLHSLNVATLAMMLARELALPRDAVALLGVGALLHDIGQHEVPDRILKKTGPLTTAEQNFFEQHPTYGVTMAQRMRIVPAGLAIIAQHHEMYDGSGYPSRLKGDAISLLARIVAITNYFDELCNPPLLADAQTPHEALSTMFARCQGKFDPKLLKAFIRCMGVYPPGTIVQLANEAVGMVSSVNTVHPMRPVVLVYDANVPRDEAIMLDMDSDPTLSIRRAIRPAQVPREVLNYLSPRMRMSYYFEGKPGEPGGAKP